MHSNENKTRVFINVWNTVWHLYLWLTYLQSARKLLCPFSGLFSTLIIAMGYKDDFQKYLGSENYQICLECCDNWKLTNKYMEEIEQRIRTALFNIQDWRIRFVMSEWYICFQWWADCEPVQCDRCARGLYCVSIHWQTSCKVCSIMVSEAMDLQVQLKRKGTKQRMWENRKSIKPKEFKYRPREDSSAWNSPQRRF